MYFCCQSEQAVTHTVEIPLVWGTMTPMRHHNKPRKRLVLRRRIEALRCWQLGFTYSCLVASLYWRLYNKTYQTWEVIWLKLIATRLVVICLESPYHKTVIKCTNVNFLCLFFIGSSHGDRGTSNFIGQWAMLKNCRSSMRKSPPQGLVIWSTMWFLAQSAPRYICIIYMH